MTTIRQVIRELKEKRNFNIGLLFNTYDIHNINQTLVCTVLLRAFFGCDVSTPLFYMPNQ